MQDAIQRAYLAGQLEWPSLTTLTPADYAAHVRRLQVTLTNLARHGADLYLALACGKADPKAVRTLEQRFFPDLNEYLARAGFEAVTRQDVFQQLLLQLCAGETPRIMSYAGRAALSSWLRVATHRLAIAIAERSKFPRKRDSDLTLNQLLSGDADPETQAAIDKARPMFQAVLRRVMDGLKDRDRTLLRLCFLDGLSIDKIGTLYGVHRATAARWICDIRQEILKEVEVVLVRDFGLRASEFKSLAFLVHSELHLSLIRVLGAA